MQALQIVSYQIYGTHLLPKGISDINPKKGGGAESARSYFECLPWRFGHNYECKIFVYFSFLVFMMSLEKKMGGHKIFLKKMHVRNFFLQKFSFKKKFILWVFEVFSKPIMFYVEDLNSEWFQLSFDIHIVYVSEKVWIFKNISYEG